MNVALYIIGAILLLWFIGGFYRHMHGRRKIIHVIDNNCTGCRACLKKCHHNVLALASEENGSHIIVKNPVKCNGCGDCLSVCKFKALELIQK
jgi:NAD-dependent dihydropyrimidine dehydrogenase PreA subunit